jgi:hypothetical protein
VAWPIRFRRGLVLVVLPAVLIASSGCGLGLRSTITHLFPATPTPTPDWVGKIEENATPLATHQARVADVDPQSARKIDYQIALRAGPGRGAEPTGFAVLPGERIFITGVQVVGGERFYKVRSFDGLKRGWLVESLIAPADRPPTPSPAPSLRGPG